MLLCLWSAFQPEQQGQAEETKPITESTINITPLKKLFRICNCIRTFRFLHAAFLARILRVVDALTAIQNWSVSLALEF